jgi:hypothetical protein
MRRLRLLVSVLVVLVSFLASTAAASARVPQGFVGVMPAPPIYNRDVNLSRQLDSMVASGVESLRVEFDWASAQPYASAADVPRARAKDFQTIGGVPTTFTASDKIVGLAARHGLSIMAVVLVTPPWAAAASPAGHYNLPRSNSSFAGFMSALVGRYGPRGSFWRQNPKIRRVPIRMWQIWNEPNLELYWPNQPWAPGYVTMLRAAHDAIKRADRGASVVLAGLPNRSWDDLEQIYKVPGARGLFDAVAVHPFTADPKGVITILQLVRAAMNRHGDRAKPMYATEVSWPSSKGKATQFFGFETTEAGQASRVASVLPMLAANRRELGLRGFYWYTWLSRDRCCDKSFEYAGLLRYSSGRIKAKPAFSAFKRAALALESCKVKSSDATRCRRR